MSEKTSLILLDENADWSGESQVVTHWSQLDVSLGQESIPQITAKQAQDIKVEYLAWVHDLGKTRVDGKTLVASLKVFENLSYWWLTSIAIKSPFENDSLYTVFKLRTLERLYIEKNCYGLVYCGNNKALHQTLKTWCEKLSHPYEQFPTKTKVSYKEKGIRKWLRKLPCWMQALIYLIKNGYLRYRHVKSMSPEKARTIKNDDRATIVSYFPNIDSEKIKQGEFWSRYWESLHPVLEQLTLKINWVWFFFDGSGFKFKEALNFRNTCNQNQPEKNRYFVLEEFLTLNVFLKALKLYLKIYKNGLRFKEVQRAFSFPNSAMNFFPVMKKEWKASFFGNLAIEGAMRIAMFDGMAKTLPANPWGLFIWENISMDFALMSAWRRHRKETRILAAQHGFFRPFDLRLYSDSRDFNETGEEAIPLPDKLCANNIEAITLLQKAGFPQEKIAKTEALRYFSLKGCYQAYKKPLPQKGRTLLVIMGITDRENQFQFQLLQEAAAAGLQYYSQIWVKPHPAGSPDALKPVYESGIKFSIKDQPLSELWSDVNVVYGAHSTGASWEASWYGIPAIATGALNSLNLNPLTGLPGFSFVTNGREFCEQLKNPQLVEIPEDYFFLDENLKLWKELLES
jgi:surface carbohydrate biosynthesis protein (TIGR04326 family)